MREILFRGKRIDDGEWVYGYYALHMTRMLAPLGDSIKDDDIKHKIIYTENTDWNMPRRLISTDVDHRTVGQYTGLRDKNGNKIFENDIVQFDTIRRKCVKEVVEFEHGAFMPFWDVCYIDDEQGEWIKEETIEIIGNIHENPELL